MSKQAQNKVKAWLTGALVAASLLVCAVGVWSAPENVIRGRALVTGTSTGALPVVSGEDLINGTAYPRPARYPWPASLTSLYVKGTATADTGWVVVFGTDSLHAEVTDSALAAGTTGAALPGRWRYVKWAEYHDDSTNTATILVSSGAFGHLYPDSILAVIDPRQGVSNQAVYMQPAPRTKMVPMGVRITYAYPGTHEVDGHVSLLERTPGQPWRERDGWNFFGDAGALVFPYDPRKTWDVPAGTQYRVAVGVTPAETRIDVDVRFDFGVQ